MVGLESQPGEGTGWQHASSGSSQLIRFQSRQCAVLPYVLLRCLLRGDVD